MTQIMNSNSVSSDLITVKVKLFAIYQETFNQEDLELQISPNMKVIEVLKQLLETKPQLKQWLTITRFGINCEFVKSDTIVKDGDEIVFIPPVSGG